MELARVQLKHCLKHSILKQTQLPLHSLAGRPTKTKCQPFTCKNSRYINTNTAVPQPEDLNRASRTCKISHLEARRQQPIWGAHVTNVHWMKAPHAAVKFPYTNKCEE